jgi:membrane associated rhomboid family serine protease
MDARAVVFRGGQCRCREFSLVLESKGIDHDVFETANHWVLTVAAPLAAQAYEEISRYGAEALEPRAALAAPAPFTGAVSAAIGYVVVLLLTAYCAGINLFGADWLAVGALDAGKPGEWWRALTALTLHVEQEHLLGNVLFGVVAGIAAGRLLGPGIAWLSILGSGVLANTIEILITPSTHRAIGASTAVFAALGMITGLAWRQRLTLRERRWYAFAPLIGGLCLLTLLGAGAEHVDVLGHGLGFACGVGLGWLFARAGIPHNHEMRMQRYTGAAAVMAVLAAWMLALRPWL